MGWNYVDLLLILLVLLSVALGWQQGFLRQLFHVACWIGSFVLALRFYQPVARWLGPRVGWNEAWDLPVAFVLTMTAASMLISLLGDALLRRLPKEMHRQWSNRLLGLVPGFAGGLISAAVAAALLLALPFPHVIHAAVQESSLANRLATSTQRVESALRPIFGDAIARTLNLLTIRPESEQFVRLPYTVAGAQPAPDLEARMLELINRERAAAGLAPLSAEPALAEVARRHSADMFARGYFAHVTPEGVDPFERIDQAGIIYLTAGENLALAPTLSVAHSGLMHSPGHRANILQPAFGRVGIGIMDGGLRGLMVTQNFRN